MRRASSVFGSLLLLALATAPASGAPSAGDVRVIAARTPADPRAAVDELERAGFRVHVVLLPGTYYVTERRPTGALPSSMGPARADDDLGALPGLRASPSLASTAPEQDPFGGRADALEPARSERSEPSLGPIAPPGIELPSGLAYGTRWEDTSEFMVGRVAVPIFFPESDGSIDPNRFDWTPALRDSVVRSAVRGFLRWSLTAGARNIPLTFLLEVHAGLSTRYEPIDRTIAQEAFWIQDALEPFLGYRDGADKMAYDAANAARGRLGAHWASLVFAVQNDTSSTGTFPDGYIAHARLGGPWFVIPVNNLNSQSAALDFYFQHEMTHQFWALDEFPAVNAWWSCTLTTGYFNQPNTNASVPADGYCGVPTVQCLMKGNYPNELCQFTAAQIGWADRDINGIVDLYETRPVVRPDSTQYRAGAGQPLTLSGGAHETAFPNRNPYRSSFGDSISIGTIDSVEYRFDAGPWIRVPCADGQCDFGFERFTVVLPPPAPGGHLVEWRAWNSNGMTAPSTSSTTVLISGTSAPIPESGSGSAPPAPRLTAGPTPALGTVRFTVRGAPVRSGRAAIHDASGRTVRTWTVAVPDDGVLVWAWDRRGSDGHAVAAGLYFVVVKLGTVTLTQRIVVLR